DILNGTFLVTNKLGYGITSTVWLARDLRRWGWEKDRYVTIKVGVNDNAFCKTISEKEAVVSENIMKAAPGHPGLFSLRKVYGSFDIQGPTGLHVCLVCQPMLETFLTYQERFAEEKAPMHVVKLTVWLMLSALDYLHRKCQLIHTDINPTNILMSVDNPTILDRVAREEYTNHPTPRKVLDDRIVYQTRHALSSHAADVGFPKLADFAWVEPGASGTLNHNIQHPLYRSPEVLLQAGWTYSIDVWNMGVLIWDMMEGKPLFEGLDPTRQNEYGKPSHLAQMIALLGPPPMDLLSRGEKTSEYFNPDGSFKYPELIPRGRSLEGSVTVFENNKDRELFFKFARRMIQWLPESRSTCRELLEDPWLGYKP
ncbi:hypothetical protein FRC12_007194, partial [Ceratobasidium sp. 428]